mmetsp:Transcript_50947/g.132363  ORF Transcript_50947/g.132363 Transcript_50947/m.132363 type:complete len:87 (+) Transcript_50947:174-434(+)
MFITACCRRRHTHQLELARLAAFQVQRLSAAKEATVVGASPHMDATEAQAAACPVPTRLVAHPCAERPGCQPKAHRSMYALAHLDG